LLMPLFSVLDSKESKRLSIVCSASSEVSRSVSSDRPGSRRHPIRRPHALCYLCDDQHRRRGRVHGLVGLRPFTVRTCRLGRRALHPGSSASSLRRRHTFACVSAFVARDRPTATESIGQKWALRAYSSRPARSRLLTRSAPLLRFRVPFSTHRPRRALIPKAAGLRTCPAPAFYAHLSPALACHGPDDRRTRRPCGFPLYQRVIAASLDPVDALGLSPAAPHHLAASLATRSMTNRTVSTQFPSSSVRRAGAVGETDSSHDLPARSRRTRRSSCSVLTPPRDLAARAGHAPTRPLRAAFRYPHPGAVARPCRTSGPSLFLASSGGAPGVRSLRRFNPVYGWSRGASTAAKYVISDISA